MTFRFTLLSAAFVAASALGAVPAAAPAATSDAMPTCAAGDPVVWENSKSKVFHAQGDSYYGKTKSGSYACQSAAVSAGYHAAGSKKSSASGTGSTGATAPVAGAVPSPAASPSGHHHHHHRHGATAASPVPAPAAT